MLAALALTGCATPSAPDYGGSWKPVNRYAATTTEIPLAQAYEFYASPMDGTLKTMLTRWSKDTGIKLSYQLSSDYTLPTPASQVHTANIRLAASELNGIFAPQGVSIAVSDWQIVVQQISAADPGTSSKAATVGSTPDVSAHSKQ